MGSSLSAVLAPSEFHPSAHDVRDVLHALSQRVPVELALVLLEQAEYWPQEVTESRAHAVVRAGPPLGQRNERIVCTSTPIEHHGRLHRIRIVTDSRDQGWSSFPEFHNTRQGSSSYFEAALLRPVPPEPTDLVLPSATMTTSSSLSSLSSLLVTPLARTLSRATSPVIEPDSSDVPHEVIYHVVSLVGDDEQPSGAAEEGRVFLHYNLHAGREFVESDKIFLRRDILPSLPTSPLLEEGEEQKMRKRLQRETRFVANARAGDIICVWAVAKYAGWLNEVRGVRIELEVAAL